MKEIIALLLLINIVVAVVTFSMNREDANLIRKEIQSVRDREGHYLDWDKTQRELRKFQELAELLNEKLNLITPADVNNEANQNE